MSTQRDWRGAASAEHQTAASPSRLPEQLMAQRPAHGLLDPSLKTIFDDLVEGVLVVDIAGHRILLQPSFERPRRRQRLPTAGNARPAFVRPSGPAATLFPGLKGTSSLLTMEGSGAASTWLELATAGRARVRTRVTISSFTGRGVGASRSGRSTRSWPKQSGPRAVGGRGRCTSGHPPPQTHSWAGGHCLPSRP